jgi:hypothetical protein
MYLIMGFELTTLVVIGTDCICSCKSIYHTITTTTTPIVQIEQVHDKKEYNTNICEQYVPITTNVVSSNPAQARCTRFNIM